MFPPLWIYIKVKIHLICSQYLFVCLHFHSRSIVHRLSVICISHTGIIGSVMIAAIHRHLPPFPQNVFSRHGNMVPTFKA